MWDEYDAAYDALHRWVKDMEVQVKDYELRSTLEEKESQLEKFKVSRGHITKYIVITCV